MVAWVQTHTCRYIRLETDISVAQHLWLLHPMFNIIYDDTKHWQGIPNCQDPISKSMIRYLRADLTGDDPHSFTNAIIDFLIIGFQTGWRGVQWAQPTCPGKDGFYLYDKPTSKFGN